MEKIFKKSLALILSAALCLTALVGCLTVSAAEGDTTKPVYSVNSVEGAAGAEVEVVASFSKISNVCAHHVIFTFPAGLEVTAVKNAAGEAYAKFDNSGERFDYKLDVAEDPAHTLAEFPNLDEVRADGEVDAAAEKQEQKHKPLVPQDVIDGCHDLGYDGFHNLTSFFPTNKKIAGRVMLQRKKVTFRLPRGETYLLCPFT